MVDSFGWEYPWGRTHTFGLALYLGGASHLTFGIEVVRQSCTLYRFSDGWIQFDFLMLPSSLHWMCLGVGVSPVLRRPCSKSSTVSYLDLRRLGTRFSIHSQEYSWLCSAFKSTMCYSPFRSANLSIQLRKTIQNELSWLSRWYMHHCPDGILPWFKVELMVLWN